MKKLFLSLFGILFLFSTAEDCLARPGRGGERGGQPPRHGQSQTNRPSRSSAATQSIASQTSSANQADFDSNREDSGFSQNRSRRGMNPPPPPPLDEDGNPMHPPDEDNSKSGFGRQGMNPPPPPPLDEDGNPMPPPDEDESDFEDDE